VYVLGVSLTSQESEQSCIYVLGVSLPSEESEQSCVCVRGIVTHKYMTAHSPGLATIPLTHTHDYSLSWLGNDTSNTYT
jgi:hypothetical protein